MPRTIRFHLDEHVDPAIAEGLRRHGIDVTTTPDAGLVHATDEDHITFGMAQRRVIFTQDQDFLRIHAAGIPHVGIAFCRQQTRTIGQIIDSLRLIWGVLEPQEMENRVGFI
jgi:predicted nuclease of predicted toxin-antitoxin system